MTLTGWTETKSSWKTRLGNSVSAMHLFFVHFSAFKSVPRIGARQLLTCVCENQEIHQAPYVLCMYIREYMRVWLVPGLPGPLPSEQTTMVQVGRLHDTDQRFNVNRKQNSLSRSLRSNRSKSIDRFPDTRNLTFSETLFSFPFVLLLTVKHVLRINRDIKTISGKS